MPQPATKVESSELQTTAARPFLQSLAPAAGAAVPKALISRELGAKNAVRMARRLLVLSGSGLSRLFPGGLLEHLPNQFRRLFALANQPQFYTVG